jgi:environmental stress-induced protein Ves
MATLTILQKEKYKRATWKNGLGFTDEIAIYPPGSVLSQANFLWRLSSARIENAAPFSLFPNHDRVLVVLKGNGLKLTHTFEEGGDEELVEIGPLEPYDFPGDVPSRCDLIKGPITDFSVFLRKAEVEPLIEIKDFEEGEEFEWMPEGRWNFAFAIQGLFDTEAGVLSEGSTLCLEYPDLHSEKRTVTIRPRGTPAKLLLVCLA